MGRHIYANAVGSSEDSGNWVHKFWLGVQNSSVEPYLQEFEETIYTAELSVDDESKIAKQVAEFKKEFRLKFSRTYASLLKEIDGGYDIKDEPPRDQMDLASKISLGEHLLATIKNMKKANVSYQTLDIEV